MTLRLGVIVNPVAGLGGRVGLKGTDGPEILTQALALGARPEAARRAAEALRIVACLTEPPQVLTCPAEMGQTACQEAGLAAQVIGILPAGRTGPEDTRWAAGEMVSRGVDLLLFAGGDGTARDICQAVDQKVPVVGVPAGVKIHSAVYAVNPKAAGLAAAGYLSGRIRNLKEAEVLDIDETAFRAGRISARLHGSLLVPAEPRFLQMAKSGSAQTEKEALQGIAAELEGILSDRERFFVVGPGTTTRAVLAALGLEKTLLGIDVVLHRKIIARDATEAEILKLVQDRPMGIVVTAIGGQGHVFGRGNQPISPGVIRRAGRENIVVVATKEKLAALEGRPLLVDTGDEDLNERLKGYLRVVTGFRDYVLYRVE